MSSMLEVLVTFIGVILILAFATQALQEVIKSAAGLKGGARMTALKGLIALTWPSISLKDHVCEGEL